MIELKVKGVDDVYIEYFNTGNHDLAKVYLKTEVDHYIAELEEKHKKEVEQLLILNREQANAANRLRDNMEQALCHQKYKRSLNNAAKYLWKRNYWRDSTPAYERQHQWENMAYKHYKRWLEHAEKYKPSKEAK